MIKFIQHSSDKYPPRTYENASADATIAFAFDFNTPGERLTTDAVKAQGKLYIPVKPEMHNGRFVTGGDDFIGAIVRVFNRNSVSTINIAGNGLYTTIKQGANQSICDMLVYEFMHALIDDNEMKPPLREITLIRSGGQSGFDEAGLKAAVRLGIPALCVCPRGWKYRDVNGTTICDEQQFKNRFSGTLIL